MTRIDIEGPIVRTKTEDGITTYGTLDRVRAQVASGPAPYAIHINSPGGSWEEALAVRSLLSELETTQSVDGACYSAATVFLTLPGKTTMMPGTMALIHAPSADASGTAKELGDAVTYLKTVRLSYAGLLSSKSKKTIEEIDALMERDTWLTAAEVVALGLADASEGTPVEAVAFAKYTAGMKVSATAPANVRLVADPVSYVAQLFGTEANAEAIASRVATLKQIETESAEMRANVTETAAKLLSETEAHKSTAASLKTAQDAVLRFEERVAKEVARMAKAAHVAPVSVSTTKQLNDSEILTQYKGIADASARLAFFNKHKDVLINRLSNS